MSHQVNAINPQSSHRPVSKWWPIGLGLGAIVCYAVGGGCVGSACVDDGYGDLYCDTGLWAAGVAFCSIGAILSIAWLVMLILWAVRRNKTPPGVAQQVLMQSHAAYQAQPVAAQHYAKEGPTVSEHDVEVGRQFCGKCGVTISTPFCQSCGAKA